MKPYKYRPVRFYLTCFAATWAFWHLPLFWIEGTYHFELRELSTGYVLNFLISVVPLEPGVRTKIWTPIGLSKGAFLCIHMRKNLLH